MINRDIRTIHLDQVRVSTFKTRAEAYFQKFIFNAGTSNVSNMPYLHYLRNHIGDLMELYAKLFGWGYGLFTTHAGEHLNKRIKSYELGETNLNPERFYTVIHLMRTKQFEFTTSIMPSKKEITCSACNQKGHNRKNKSCPLHSSHPTLEFEESDDENGE